MNNEEQASLLLNDFLFLTLVLANLDSQLIIILLLSHAISNHNDASQIQEEIYAKNGHGRDGLNTPPFQKGIIDNLQQQYWEAQKHEL